MNNVIKAIATAMIIILIGILIWIFLSYYKENETLESLSYDFPSGSFNVSTLEIPSGNSKDKQDDKLNNNTGLIESIINNSSEKTDSGNSQLVLNSGDNLGKPEISGETLLPEKIIDNNIDDENYIKEGSGDENSGDVLPSTIIEIPSEEEPSQILITSDSQTSNQQKQEILTEIDKALQGLLEAVGKVEVVDEERLDATLNSEVDES